MPRRGRVLWSGTSGRPSRMPTKRNEPAHCGRKSFLFSSLFRFCNICCAHPGFRITSEVHFGFHNDTQLRILCRHARLPVAIDVGRGAAGCGPLFASNIRPQVLVLYVSFCASGSTMEHTLTRHQCHRTRCDTGKC